MLIFFVSGWTVCQVSVLTSPSQPHGELYISQLRNADSYAHLFTSGDVSSAASRSVLVQRLPGFSTRAGAKVLRDFAHVMEESANSMKLTDNITWFEKRSGLDGALKVCTNYKRS